MGVSRQLDAEQLNFRMSVIQAQLHGSARVEEFVFASLERPWLFEQGSLRRVILTKRLSGHYYYSLASR
jgi:hypothetical protein